MLDSLSRVLSHNVIALRCLGDGLVLGGKRLSAIDRVTDQRLQSVIRSAVTCNADQNAALTVAVQRRLRLPLVVRTIRLKEDTQRPTTSAMLLLLVFDPELRQGPPPEILTQAFRLTQAESDVAIGILSGKSFAEIAAIRGVKIGTVRAYSKAVFSKTHTRGQADLTGVLTRLAFVAPKLEADAMHFSPNRGLNNVAGVDLGAAQASRRHSK